MPNPPDESSKAENLRESVRAAWKPPVRTSVDQWADSFRKLAKESGASSGQWSTSKVEAARGPMKAVTEPGVHEITLMACTQLMKTEFINNAWGYTAHIDPGPALLLQPKEDAAKKFSKERIGPLIKATPVLSELVAQGNGSDAEAGVLFKPHPGGYLALAGAGSPTDLASRPIRYLFCDEIDKYPITREGDGITLASERTATFDLNYLIVLACSPTIEDDSRIAQSYLESDQRRASVACPSCGHRQFLDFFKHVDWDKRRNSKGEVVEHLTATARLHCESCGSVWSEGDRLQALQTTRWHQTKPFDCCGERRAPLALYDAAWRAAIAPEAPEPVGEVWDWWHDDLEGRYAVYRARCPKCGKWGVDNKHAGFQASKLFSPSQKDRPADIAGKWIKAKGDAARELSWWNTQMGLPHRPSAGKHVDVDVLLERRETWGEDVPDEVGVITVGIDTQGDRLELEVVGWGRDEESWSLAYEVIEGEISEPEVQARLDAYLRRTWRRADGKSMTVKAACIDSGGNHTNDVYKFSKARLQRRIWAIKGASEQDGVRNPVWPTKRPSRRNKAAFRPVVIGGNTARDVVRTRLAMDATPALGVPLPGYMHFPDDRDIGYFQQLLADRIELKTIGIRTVRLWVTPPGRANEASDCRVYAYAALQGLIHMGFKVNQAVARIRGEIDAPAAPSPEALDETEQQAVPAVATAAPPTSTAPPRRRSLAERLA